MVPYYVVIHSTDPEGQSTEVLAKIAIKSRQDGEEIIYHLTEMEHYTMYRHNFTIERGDV